MATLSEFTVSQLEIVEVLEDVFNGDIHSEHASDLSQFDDLSEAYYTLGDYYLQDGQMLDAVKSKERAVLLKVDCLQLVDKVSNSDEYEERLKIIVEHFANLGYLCQETCELQNNMLDKSLRYYEASTVRAKEIYGEDSLDYAMTLVPYGTALLAVATRDSSAARVTVLLERLTDEVVHKLATELDADHELIKEAQLALSGAKTLSGKLSGDVLNLGGFGGSNSRSLLDAAMGDEMDLPLPGEGDSLVGGNSISTLGVQSSVSFDESVTVMSENYQGGKMASKAAAAALGAFGGSRNQMLAMINEKADADAEAALLSNLGGDQEYGGDDVPSTFKEGPASLKTTISRAHEVVRSAEVLHDTGDKLEYSVDYLHLSPDQPDLVLFFQRQNEEAYAAVAGPHCKFEMNLFPAQLKEGGRYRAESVRLARYGMSARIRRLMLNDEVTDLKDKIQEWLDLKELCIRKKEAYKNKMLALENELILLADDRNNNGAKTSRPIESFSAFLTTRDGWKVVTDLLQREIKRLQNPDHNLAGTEEVAEYLSIQDCQEIWEMLYFWQLFYSMQVRARVGLKHYPVHAREEKKKVSAYESESESDTEERRKKDKAAKKARKSQKQKEREKATQREADISASHALASVKEEKGDEEGLKADIPEGALQESRPDTALSEMEEHLAKIREASRQGADASGDTIVGSAREDLEDASTIMSASSVGNASATDTGNNQNQNTSLEQVEKENTPVEEKKSPSVSSGWGFGNLFSSSTPDKEEEEVQVEAKVITLDEIITSNNGVGVCEWGEVCKLLGCMWSEEEKDISLLGACRAALRILENHLKNDEDELQALAASGEEGSQERNIGVQKCLKQCVSRIDVNDLMMGINELLPQDMTNAWVESVMIKLTNAIAKTVERRFIDSLRLYDKWCKNLENMKKDRVKKEGGSLKEDAEGTTEVDKHGQIRIIPHSDTIVDTDIVHGNKQRSQISVVMPILVNKLTAAHAQLFQLEGELACCIQYAYVLATPYIQRVIRGTLGRMRRNLRRYDSAYYSLHMATVTLQGWYRAIAGRKAFAAKKAGLMSNLLELMAIKCQASIRMFIHAHKYRKFVKEKKDASEWFAITTFQALIRGFNARHKTAKIKAANAAETLAEVKDWSIKLIQRWARGCIARGTIIRSLKVRKTISKDVLLMSEKYLDKGDLWGFLKNVDDTFRVLNKQIKDNQEKEDELAVTFVNKVLAKRQGDFDGAWDRFTGAVTRPGEGPPPDPDTLTALGETGKGSWGANSTDRTGGFGASRGAGTAGGGTIGGDGNLADSPGNRSYKTTGTAGTARSRSSRSTSSKRNGDTMKASHPKAGALGPGNENNVPGPLLRRAISATVQEGITREKKNKRVDVDHMDYPGSHKARKREEAQKARAGKKEVKMVNGKPVRQKPKKGAAPPKGKMYATTTDWAWANATGTLEPEPQRPPPKPREIQPGESLLVDIPKGLDDSLERMVHAISLVTFIPEFSNASSSEEAYELYKIMPNGLAKMRYEIEAHKWCQPQINKLRLKGIHNIRDALPLNKFRQYMNSVDMPLEVVGMAVKWVRMLLAMGDVPAGKVHPETAERQAEVKAGIGTVGQLKSVGIKSPDKGDNGNDGSKKIVAVQLEDGSTVYQEASEAGGKPQDGDTIMINGVEQKVETKPLLGDEQTAGKVLLNLVEGGEWCSMTASAEELLIHAAFLVVAHSVTRTDKFGTHEEFSEMGHLAFKKHTAALQRMETEEERREAIRKRFRAALLMATPFALRLKADGILTVQDVVKNAEMITKLKLPPQMETQVESMVSTAVASAVSAKQAPTIRDHCDTAAETFTVPMIYDQKFQRGPFDPYGKPPRFIQPANLKSNIDKKNDKERPVMTSPIKKKKNGASAASSTSASSSRTGATASQSGGGVKEDDDSDSDSDSELRGRGLWEKKLKNAIDTNTIKNVENMFSLQTLDAHVSKEEKAEEDEIRREIARREAEWQQQQPDDEYEMLEKQNASKRDSTAAKKARMLMHDFEARVRAGFERPFKCRFEGCSQAFSRAYTLKIHEKSHKLFGNYHKWKKDPQLFLDKDKETMAKEAHDLAESRTLLPPIVQDDLEALKLNAHNKAVETVAIARNEEQYGDLYAKLRDLGVDTDIEEKQLSLKLNACKWPERQEPAAAVALAELPEEYRRGESRENTPSAYERPFSGANAMDGGVHLHTNWGLGASVEKRGEEINLHSRSGSRSGSRTSSRTGSTRMGGALSPIRGGSRGRGVLDRGAGEKPSTPKSPGKGKRKSKSGEGTRAISPSHDILRNKIEQHREQSPMFRAIASRERLSSKGNIPPVDSLRGLSAGAATFRSDFDSDASFNPDGWGSSSAGYNCVDFESLTMSMSAEGIGGIRPGTGYSMASRPGTVDSIDEGDEQADGATGHIGLRFGNSILADEDEEVTGFDSQKLVVDPFAQPYDEAY